MFSARWKLIQEEKYGQPLNLAAKPGSLLLRGKPGDIWATGVALFCQHSYPSREGGRGSGDMIKEVKGNSEKFLTPHTQDSGELHINAMPLCGVGRSIDLISSPVRPMTKMIADYINYPSGNIYSERKV